MSLQFLRDTPENAFQHTIEDLRSMNPKIDASVFEAMTLDQIDTMLDRLVEREQRIIDESAYGAWFTDPAFMQIKMLQDSLTNLREHRELLEATEHLVPGYTYYNGVRQFGHLVEGRLCTYMGEGHPANWINFIDCAPIMKALEVVKHGDTHDFRRIYVEIANGRADGLQNVSVEHITESTDKALLEMEAYCDARWEGPWPWDESAPYRLGRVIEEHKRMRQQDLIEMQEIMDRMHATLVRQLYEFDSSGQEGFAIQAMINEMRDNVQAMIEKFAKLAGDAMINLRAAVMQQQGDEGAMQVEHGLTHAVNQAADALARLKMQLDRLVEQLGFAGGLGMGGSDPGMGGDIAMGGGAGGNMGAGGDMGAAAGGMGMGGADDMAAGGGMGAPGMDAGAGAAGGMPAGPDMAAAPTPEAPGGQVQPERPRKKA